MYYLYNLILTFLLVLLLPVWLIILLSGRKYRAGFKQKTGFLPVALKEKIKSFARKPVWFHAVSVGETIAVSDLVKEFKYKYPEYPVVFTTVTFTGQEIAKKRLGEIATIFYFPYDIGFITRKVIEIIDPCLVVIVETEIWPNFAANLYKKNIPLLLINGRLSPKSYRNYKFFKPLVSIVLKYFSRFLMQTDLDAKRIIDIGADKDKVDITGNLKYDIKKAFTFDQVEDLKNELCLTDADKVIIAGSTHSGEESIILDVFLKLCRDIHDLKLIIVPRHPERYDEVINILDSSKVSFCRRSLKNSFKEAPVFLLDTMGELSGFYSIADVAFIGGSIIEKGGHNPLEPAVYSKPVVIGPHTFNFHEITKYMVEAGAAIQFNDQEQLYSVLSALLTDNSYYEKAQVSCKKVFEANRGATERTLHVIATYLNE
jgi:3-deoxy-D-manno-octulosonic-acid transferase